VALKRSVRPPLTVDRHLLFTVDHAAGLVITRQWPGTATGVVFLTLEDETGPLNIIVWSSLFERERRIVLGARLMGVTGEVQREGEVVHLIARKLEDRTALLGGLRTVSRDFC